VELDHGEGAQVELGHGEDVPVDAQVDAPVSCNSMATGTTRVVGGYENQLRCDWLQASY
jgi:hypothetical protein